jgi:fatty-acyl-CoA synthase
MHPLLVGDLSRINAARAPQRAAVALGGKSLSFAELDAAAERIARLLLARGVWRGDRVAWWAETSLEACALFLGTARIGAAFTPLNPRYTAEEAAAVLRIADPTLVLTDDGRGGHETLERFLEGKPRRSGDWPNVSEKDAQVIFFTSGTTGEPKGCVLPHRVQRLRAGFGGWSLGPNVCMFPQFHMAGWTMALSAWSTADTVVFVPRPDAENLLEAVHRHRGHQLYCIPAVWQRILEADRSRYDLSSLRRTDTGTSATTQPLLRGIADTFPQAQISIAYGSTEAGRVCTLGPGDIFRKPDSVGAPSAGVEVRLDEAGELWVRSPFLFSGYFRNAEATKTALVDGWFRHGELAVRDDEGYYSIVGRAKDIVRTGGETVSPVEVDLVLLRHPAIADAAVAGIPHDDWGEVLAAFVVLKPGATLDLAALRNHCEGTLAPHKRPRQLFVVKAIPRTGATGQVQRRRLIELASPSPAA